MQGSTLKGIGIAFGVLFALGALFWFIGTHNVDQGEVGVIEHSNGSMGTLPAGRWQFVMPMANTVTFYDIKSQLHSNTAEGITKDLQLVKVEVAVLYHPDESQITWIHKNLGPNYADRVVQPSVQDAVKAAVSYWNAEELTAATREQVKTDIASRITSDVGKEHVIVDQVSITDFDFSDEFNHATELKVIAQQDALQARNKLEQTKFEANATIIQAQAQAESARIISEQIQQNPQYVDYLYARAFQDHWNGQLPTVSSGAGAVPFLNVPTPGGSGAPFRSG